MPTLKPATPLPWFASEIDSANNHDAAYIAHACNAYPRLVASLQALAGHEDDFYQTDATIAARALLRELGEG